MEAESENDLESEDELESIVKENNGKILTDSDEDSGSSGSSMEATWALSIRVVQWSYVFLYTFKYIKNILICVGIHESDSIARIRRKCYEMNDREENRDKKQRESNMELNL